MVVDKAKLKKLRELYSDADGSEYLTPRFRHVGEKLADRPRFSLTDSLADIEEYFRDVVAARVIHLSVGGDHQSFARGDTA